MKTAKQIEAEMKSAKEVLKATAEEAEAALKKPKKKETKKKTTKKTKTLTKQQKREQQFKKLSGRKRLRSEEKQALKAITAKELLENKKKKLTAKQIDRRVATFRKRYGEPTAEQEMILKYATPAKVAKAYGMERLYDDIEVDPESISTRYDDLPSFMKNYRVWVHDGGSNPGLLYASGFFFGGYTTMADITTGKDHTREEFLKLYLATTGKYWYDEENDKIMTRKYR